MTNATIGKFEVLSRLSRGGMADVYRCCLRGIGGFEKVVVVKRIRAERAADPEFVTMFLDEARLAANLNHPNIVQVFEIDEADGNPYIAMEYVGGPTLALLMRAARRLDRLNIAHAARILAGVCEGLHYAHTATAPTGEPLGLVHRDVSPQNIIVSREGVPKLLDFGVAKANGRLTETLAGTLKGKLRYIAPEQLCRAVVDHRADVFAVGVCLFEATTGQSPYGPAIADELSLLESIGRGRHARPGEVVPGYPAALEEIVVGAMEPDPERRCPSARALQERLEAFLAAGPHQSSTRAVADWVNELCPAVEESGPVPRAPAGALVETAAELLTPAAVPTRRLSERPGRWRGHSRRAAVAVVAAAGLLGGAAAALLARRPAPPPAKAVATTTHPPAGPSCGTRAARESKLGPHRFYGPALDHQVAARPARETLTSGRRRQGRPPEVAPPPLEPPAVAAGVAADYDDEAAPVAQPPASPELTATSVSLLAAPTVVAAAPPPAEPPARRHEVSPPRVGAVYSARPRPSVPRPNLPKAYTAQGADDLQAMLGRVEEEAIRAGCSADFARGVTGALFRTLSAQRAPELFPSAMYYFIVNEAALGREKRVAEQELRRAHSSGIVRALARLPADER